MHTTPSGSNPFRSNMRIRRSAVSDLANHDPRESASVTGQSRDSAAAASPKTYARYALASASAFHSEWAFTSAVGRRFAPCPELNAQIVVCAVSLLDDGLVEPLEFRTSVGGIREWLASSLVIYFCCVDILRQTLGLFSQACGYTERPSASWW